MIRARILFGIAALTVSAASHAGSSSGLVTSMYVHGPDDIHSSSPDGVLIFTTTGPQTGKPACSVGEWAIGLNTQLGRAMQSLLKTAAASNKTVRVVGEGRCSDWSDRETPHYVVIGGTGSSTDWYTIKNHMTNTCIEATTENGALTLAACNPYNLKQRFTVINTTWDANSGNDDYFYIDSVAFPGHYIYRPYTADGHISLGTAVDGWSRFELKAYENVQVVNREWKKMTITNLVAGVYNTACVTTVIPSAELNSTWGNCVGQILFGSGGVKMDFLEFQFRDANNSIGYFNDR